MSENELVETKEVLEKVRNRYLSTKEKVDKERVKTQKGEDLAISAEQAIVEREKDLKTAEKQVTALKQQCSSGSQDPQSVRSAFLADWPRTFKQ